MPVVDRACFLLHLRPELVEEYLRVHEQVWPEVLRALTRCGWRNYSLFVRRSDGLVVGYCETDDFAAAVEAMGREEVNDRWQDGMQRFFTSGGHPDAGLERLEEYFHLA